MNEDKIKTLKDAAIMYARAATDDGRAHYTALSICCDYIADQLACQEQHGGIYDREPTPPDQEYDKGWNDGIEACADLVDELAAQQYDDQFGRKNALGALLIDLKTSIRSLRRGGKNG